jgi:hypothetical protein
MPGVAVLVSTPLAAPIVAMVPLLLVHEPLGVASVSVVLDEGQIVVAPAMASGDFFTVAVAVLPQPLAATPVTVYTAVLVGFPVTVAPVVAERPDDGLQL